jgi:hypothetical protein
MDSTSGETQAKLILLHSISSKISPQEKGGMKGQQYMDQAAVQDMNQ